MFKISKLSRMSWVRACVVTLAACGFPRLFFADRPRKDFHLSPNSPARGKAEPGLGVADDLEGRPRPEMADVGAYQAR